MSSPNYRLASEEGQLAKSHISSARVDDPKLTCTALCLSAPRRQQLQRCVRATPSAARLNNFAGQCSAERSRNSAKGYRNSWAQPQPLRFTLPLVEHIRERAGLPRVFEPIQDGKRTQRGWREHRMPIRNSDLRTIEFDEADEGVGGVHHSDVDAVGQPFRMRPQGSRAPRHGASPSKRVPAAQTGA